MTTTARELFDDLLTLEVNIIVKPGMTGRKMPDVPQALLDIFSDYDLWLCGRTGEWNERWAVLRAGPKADEIKAGAVEGTWPLVDGQLAGGLDTGTLLKEETKITAGHFDTLRERARNGEKLFRLLVIHRTLEDDGSAVILKRIYRNCDQIKAILEGRDVDRGKANPKLKKAAERGFSRGSAETGDVPLAADEVLVVRKAWELGVERVLMQTVAQLDGDVITRVQESRLTAGGKPLFDLHDAAVGTALQHWQFLVQTFVQITTKAAGFLPR